MSVDALLAAIKLGIETEFSSIATVDFTADIHDRLRGSIDVPAVLIDCVRFPVLDDSMVQGEIRVTAQGNLFVLVDFKRLNAQSFARHLALQLGRFIHRRNWSVSGAHPTITSNIEKDDFSPELDRFEVWRVDFSFIVTVSPESLEGYLLSPETVLFSYVPRVGPPHEPAYRSINEFIVDG